MPINIQFQFGGSKNQQVILQTIQASLGKQLNDAEERLRERTFQSAEIRKKYVETLTEFNQWILANRDHAFNATPYIRFPFKTSPEEETIQDGRFVEAILDTLSIIAFSDFECVIEHDHMNIRINGQQVFGMYYTQGTYDLADSFARLLKAFKDRGVAVPVTAFIFIILACPHPALEPEKIKNIVTNILGEDAFIKPLQNGHPKCLSVTSYIIQNCQTVEEAKIFIREVLSVA